MTDTVTVERVARIMIAPMVLEEMSGKSVARLMIAARTALDTMGLEPRDETELQLRLKLLGRPAIGPAPKPFTKP